jgi:hypothetical protein
MLMNSKRSSDNLLRRCRVSAYRDVVDRCFVTGLDKKLHVDDVTLGIQFRSRICVYERETPTLEEGIRPTHILVPLLPH